MHEQITKEVGKMNICMSRFGVRIGWRKYMYECTPFGYVNLCKVDTAGTAYTRGNCNTTLDSVCLSVRPFVCALVQPMTIICMHLEVNLEAGYVGQGRRSKVKVKQ